MRLPSLVLYNSFAEFFAKAKNKVKTIFGRGVYVDKNTSQAASVEFVCRWQANYARSRLQMTGGKARRVFSTSSKKEVSEMRLPFCRFEKVYSLAALSLAMGNPPCYTGRIKAKKV